MPSITDDITSKASRDGTNAVKKAAAETFKTGRPLVKGLCLLLYDGAGFTARNVMIAVKNTVYKKTGDIKYSANNIDISKLKASGKVHKVDEDMTADVMKHFDRQCKKYGVKYSAMLDERNPDKPAYMVFFEGRDSNLILQVMTEAYKDYMDAEKEEKNPNSKKKNIPEKRESVKAKLAFFRDRVANRDREQDVKEKHHSHSDIQR